MYVGIVKIDNLKIDIYFNSKIIFMLHTYVSTA